MSLYNFSSVNSENYNTLRVRIPNHFLTQYVNMTVSTFTCNCNIEVMNTEDFIEFLRDGKKIKVYMEQYSKLDTASLPHILQDIFDKKCPEITVSLTNIDTIKFISDKAFDITDMSYNMKLILGFYCTKDSDFPFHSKSFESEELEPEPEEKDIKDITFHNLNMKTGDYLPLERTIDPPNAYGFTITYIIANPQIATIDENGYVSGISPGETKISIEVRNPNSSLFVQADFNKECTIKVAEPQEVDVQNLELPTEITITKNDSQTIYPKVEPFYVSYISIWTSDNPDIATVNNGYIRGINTGNTTIRFQIKSKEGDKIFDREINVIVKSEYHTVQKYQIVSDSVGYMLSTPILYLLTNIGNSVFFNEIHDQNKIQCGTVCMCMNNSYASSMPIVAMQGEITTKCAINATSDIFFILVDANMRPVKLLNPFYITVSIQPDIDQEVITPGLLNK